MERCCVELLESRRLLAAAVTGFSQNDFVSGIERPTTMDFAPDGRLFVCEQGGALRVVKDGALLSAPFVTLSVDARGERGLIGVTFDPDFTANHFVYVTWTATSPTTHNRISRFTADPNNPEVALAGSEMDLFDFPSLSSATNHNGGALHFGPDGKLYASAGDNANGSNAQSLQTTLGKIIRINSDGSIPTDNPFYSQTSGSNRAIWAIGFRNPFTFNFEPSTGKMFINDVGQGIYEEVDVGTAGGNYGWPQTEGPTSNPSLIGPLYSYIHGMNEVNGCAITGATFYDPPDGLSGAFPDAYRGKYFFTDFCKGYVKFVDPATAAATTFATGLVGTVDVRVGPDAALYVAGLDFGTVYRFSFDTSGAASIGTHPVSQTIAAGQPVTFSVVATGNGPFTYQWQRDGADIDDANADTLTLPAVQTSDNGAQFSVIVTNSVNSVTSNAATLTVVEDQPPEATIKLPAEATIYRAGQKIRFSGAATDTEEGRLPASALTWEIVFHHADHTHPFIAPFSGKTGGSFKIPATGETSADVFYRIHLSVTDSDGLTTEVTRDIHPVTAQINLATNIAGLNLTLDSQPISAPSAFEGVAGFKRTLAAPPTQTVGGVTYDFVAWSDHKPASHAIVIPPVDTTYTAIYRPETGDGLPDLVGAVEASRSGAGRFKIDLSLSNLGPIVADNTIGIDLLLSSDVARDGGDTLLLHLTRKIHLNVAQRRNVRIRLDAPPATGEFHLLAQIDTDNIIEESDETNNLAVSLTTLQLPFE